ncbi:MAG: cytochrome c3 family protein [Ignavibacteria bacterium]|nr:cytochrome c3 family protein [Ignavibacteria bacterium]
MTFLKNILSKIKLRWEKVRQFYSRGKKPVRILKYSTTIILALLILTAFAAEFTSRPRFCTTCHYMQPFYDSWKMSAHSNITCTKCHFEPGIAGTVRGKLEGLVQVAKYVSQAYRKSKPWAEIPDESCLQSGCHETRLLDTDVEFLKAIKFNHKHHLTELRRGKKLRCTSCHSQIVQGDHIAVTETTCFTCHFKVSDDAEHNIKKLSDCKTCHDWQHLTFKEMEKFRYNHTSVLEKNIECTKCHENTIAGNGDVPRENCYLCHFEISRLQQYDRTELIHTKHITENKIECQNCHNAIEHKIQRLKADQNPDCISCHAGSHQVQLSLYIGTGGKHVEPLPSKMYLDGINCKGCHILHEETLGRSTTKAIPKSCELCHGPGYGKLIKQWELAAERELSEVSKIYNTVSSIVISSSSSKKQQAKQLLEEAKFNMNLVKMGKSVHNINYSQKLILASYDLIKESANLVNPNFVVPTFVSSSKVVPGDCATCHVGIEEIKVKIFEKDFSHNKHILQNKIECSRCHSNAFKHGQLLLSEQDCRNCHHKDIAEKKCENCHSIQSEIFNGTILNSNQPDIMKEAGVTCEDCHLSEEKKVYKPLPKACVACHESEYEQTYKDWLTDLLKQTRDLRNLIESLRSNPSALEKINEAESFLKKIDDDGRRGIHNYELVSSLLVKMKKNLINFK